MSPASRTRRWPVTAALTLIAPYIAPLARPIRQGIRYRIPTISEVTWRLRGVDLLCWTKTSRIRLGELTGRTMARPRKRIPLEDGLKLDVNKLRVQAIAQRETTQQVVCCYPRYSGDARRFGLLVWRFSSGTRGSMRLLLRSLDQSIDLVAASRHFGGVQWYFLCPLTGRRASVLWMPPGTSCFASRQAWGGEVAYASQFITAPFRALSRAHDIRHRLGDKDYIRVFDPPLPSKPRGMHCYTYEALLDRLAFYERKCDLYVEKRIARHNTV